jgi:chemotaxis signal transduction protein
MHNSLTVKYNKNRFCKIFNDLKISHLKTISEPIKTKDKDEKKYLIFTLDNDFFGIDISKLIAVLFKKKIVEIPFEESVYGIINHQNTILTVLNLYNIFNIKQNIGKNYYIIIFKHEKAPSAILCNKIINITEIEENKIISEESDKTIFKTNIIAGNIYINNNLITIINTDLLYEM